MNSSRRALFLATFFGVAALGAVTLGASMLAGCKSRSPEDAIRDKVRAKVKEAVEKNRDSVEDFGNISTSNSKLVERDANGRVLWTLKFKLGKIHDEVSDDSGKVTSPRHGDLQNATAEIYQNGRAESSFHAPIIVFTDTPNGIVLKLSGGVRAKTLQKAATETAATETAATETAATETSVAKANNSAPAKTNKSKTKTARTSAAPLELSTRNVEINLNSRQLRADSPTTMTQAQTVVVAQRLVAETSLAVARVSGGVVANSPQGRVTAQNAVWSWGKGRAQATGNVVLTHEGTRLVGQTLDADANIGRGALSGKGGVVAISAQGRAKAERVLYNWSARRLSAQGGVTLQKNDATLRAAEINSDDKLNQAEARGAVVLTKGDAVVNATRLQAFEQMARVVASSGVTVRRGNGAQSETLSANAAQVWLNEKRVVANGNVRLSRADGTLTASNATYSSSDGHATASGDVVIKRQGATLTADRADYWTGAGRASGSGHVVLTRSDVTVRANRVEALEISDQQRTKIVAEGDVRAVSRANGGTVRGQRVTWNADGAGSGAVATGDVSLQKGENALGGQRLQTDAQFHTATISGGVSGQLANGATFSAPAARWVRVLDNRVLPQNGRVTARGGVTLRQGKITLKAPELDASGDGKNALLSDGVVATAQDGAQVRSQTARYDAARGTIVAQGDVWYRDAGGNRLHGSNLVAKIVGNTFKDATLENVQGQGKSQILDGKTLFGN